MIDLTIFNKETQDLIQKMRDSGAKWPEIRWYINHRLDDMEDKDEK